MHLAGVVDDVEVGGGTGAIPVDRSTVKRRRSSLLRVVVAQAGCGSFGGYLQASNRLPSVNHAGWFCSLPHPKQVMLHWVK